MNFFKQFYLKCLVKSALGRKDMVPVEGIHGMLVSSHVLLFLNQYNRKASRILKDKRVRFLLHRNGGKLHSAWKSVPNGLEYARTSIGRLQTEIAEADVRCNAVQAELERSRKIYRVDQAEHMVQLCINRMLDANKQNALQVMQMYQQIHEIANRQLEVLIDTERKMNRALEDMLDLVECYYIALCAVAPGKSIIPSIQELQALSPIQGFPEKYSIARDDAQQICEACLQQIKELKDQITP